MRWVRHVACIGRGKMHIVLSGEIYRRKCHGKNVAKMGG
jgi:hypothetical protein